MKKPIVAILYDFDSTLAKSDMQNFGFIPSLGLTPEQFWAKTGDFCEKSGMERTLGYLYVMLKSCEEKGINMTKEWLKEQGKNIEYWPGVIDWFERINEFGKENGLKVEHYLVSSGNKEIIEGCSIAKQFMSFMAASSIMTNKAKPFGQSLRLISLKKRNISIVFPRVPLMQPMIKA